MAVITIIGSGMMGSALAFPARENGHEVRLVGTHLDRDIIKSCLRKNRHPKLKTSFPDGVRFFQIEAMEEAIEGADLIIGGVSSFGVDWFGEHVLPAVPEKTPVLSVTKGLLDCPDGRLLTYPEVWAERLAKKGMKRNLNAVGGPSTSYELVAHDHTEVAFCGPDMETLRRIRTMMATDYYHISLTTDVRGIESAVALKNGYALGVALTIGLGQRVEGIGSEPHYNSQAGVFGQAVREMDKLLKLQGAVSLDTLAIGIGDLYVTIFGGRTRLVGILLGRGLPVAAAKAELKGVTLESLVVAERVGRAVKILAKQGKINLAEFPLLCHIDEILAEGKPVDIPWDAFTFERM